MPVGELLAVEGFDEDIVEELRSRARDALLNEALAAEEELDEHQPADDLLSLDGMDESHRLRAGRARRAHPRRPGRAWPPTRSTDIEGMDEERAAALIMEARKHWFE